MLGTVEVYWPYKKQTKQCYSKIVQSMTSFEKKKKKNNEYRNDSLDRFQVYSSCYCLLSHGQWTTSSRATKRWRQANADGNTLGIIETPGSALTVSSLEIHQQTGTRI